VKPLITDVTFVYLPEYLVLKNHFLFDVILTVHLR